MRVAWKIWDLRFYRSIRRRTCAQRACDLLCPVFFSEWFFIEWKKEDVSIRDGLVSFSLIELFVLVALLCGVWLQYDNAAKSYSYIYISVLFRITYWNMHMFWSQLHIPKPILFFCFQIRARKHFHFQCRNCRKWFCFFETSTHMKMEHLGRSGTVEEQVAAANKNLSLFYGNEAQFPFSMKCRIRPWRRNNNNNNHYHGWELLLGRNSF